MKFLLSSPEEEYLKHIDRVKSKLESILPRYESTLCRVMVIAPNSNSIKDALTKMIYFHDIGKLTKRWQERLGGAIHISHAPIGAAYLWRKLPSELREPICFAVAIHHSDRGLLGDNIEKPDVQAINNGIINHTSNQVIWDERTGELDPAYFPKELVNLNLNDLRDMARGLRLWARGCGLLEQHTRRVQAMLIHHVLKLCDISAASERKEFEKKGDQDFFGGWLMVENIINYVNSIEYT